MKAVIFSFISILVLLVGILFANMNLWTGLVLMLVGFVSSMRYQTKALMSVCQCEECYQEQK